MGWDGEGLFGRLSNKRGLRRIAFYLWRRNAVAVDADEHLRLGGQGWLWRTIWSLLQQVIPGDDDRISVFWLLCFSLL